MARARRGSPAKAGGSPSKKVKGTPRSVGPVIASLSGSGVAGGPPSRGAAKGHKNRGYKGSPIVATNPIDVGERGTSPPTSGTIYPKVYGKGSPQLAKQPKAPKARGSSASGSQGAK